MGDGLKGIKIFDRFIHTPIEIGDDGYIGIFPSDQEEIEFNIKDVSEYKLVVDDKKNVAGSIGKSAIIGGLTGGLGGSILGALSGFGGSISRPPSKLGIIGALAGAATGGLMGYGKTSNQINSIYLSFKINDFHNPFISVPLFNGRIDANSYEYKNIQNEIEKIFNTLEIIKNRINVNSKNKEMPRSKSNSNEDFCITPFNIQENKYPEPSPKFLEVKDIIPIKENFINNSNPNIEKNTSQAKYFQNDLIKFYCNLIGLNIPFSNEELYFACRRAAIKYHPKRYEKASSMDRENAAVLMKQTKDAYEMLKRYCSNKL